MKLTQKKHPPLSTGKHRNKSNSKKTADSQTGRKHGKRGNKVKKADSQLKLTDERFSTVYVSPSGKRVPFSIRIDSAIKKAWMQFVLEKGLSSCEIIEKTLLGIMHGYQAPVYASHTINVIVDFPRIVKRVRRRQIYFEDEVEVSVEDEQPVPKCFVCPRPAVGEAVHIQSGKHVLACEKHLEELRVHPKWQVLGER